MTQNWLWIKLDSEGKTERSFFNDLTLREAIVFERRLETRFPMWVDQEGTRNRRMSAVKNACEWFL